MQTRPFGNTGLTVSILGLGAGQVGDARLPEAEAEQLLNQALDLGLTLIDTARGYGLSEERIGKYLAHRRGEFVLSTKVGYDIPGHADWTYGCIQASVEAALGRLRTDCLDIVHLHSCGLDVLQRGEVIQALEDARQAGKLRLAAYSGENEALDFAVACGRFQSIETSVNFCDQRGLLGPIALAELRGLGVIAKRPVANAPWRFAEWPVGNYAEEYWQRWQAMQLDPHGLDWQELALRFTAFAPGVSASIVGTTNLAHLQQNIALLAAGPLPPAWFEEIRQAFQLHDQNWIGQV
jgi:aryl-alcohol dehydrogenase-like predicted oxidoreductase